MGVRQLPGASEDMMRFSWLHFNNLHKDYIQNGPTGQRANGLNGQALVEFAVFGSLALLALVMMIQMGLGINFQQEVDQEAFRRAMSAAKDEGDLESASTSFYMIRNRQMPDPSQPFAIMPRQRFESQAMIVWGERLANLADDKESEPRTIVDMDKMRLASGSLPVYRSSDLVDEPGGAEDEKKPLISRINTTATSLGTSWGNPTDTGLASTTTSTVQMTLNTNINSTLTSTLTAGCAFSGIDWKCP